MGKRRILTGHVISNKMDKTVVVKVSTRRQHRRYKKFINYFKKYKAHDQENACNTGDMVTLVETRPLSKEKRWRVSEILERAE